MGGRAVTRRRIALQLTALVAASGVLPLLLLAVFGLQILSQRGERASQEALQAIATQAAARIGAYIAQQREMLRTIGTAVAGEADAARRPTGSSASGRCSASASASRDTRSPSTARDGWSPPAPARCDRRCSAASRSRNPRSPRGC